MRYISLAFTVEVSDLQIIFVDQRLLYHETKLVHFSILPGVRARWRLLDSIIVVCGDWFHFHNFKQTSDPWWSKLYACVVSYILHFQIPFPWPLSR
jgi:hypothetical protein